MGIKSQIITLNCLVCVGSDGKNSMTWHLSTRRGDNIGSVPRNSWTPRIPNNFVGSAYVCRIFDLLYDCTHSVRLEVMWSRVQVSPFDGISLKFYRAFTYLFRLSRTISEYCIYLSRNELISAIPALVSHSAGDKGKTCWSPLNIIHPIVFNSAKSWSIAIIVFDSRFLLLWASIAGNENGAVANFAPIISVNFEGRRNEIARDLAEADASRKRIYRWISSYHKQINHGIFAELN